MAKVLTDLGIKNAKPKRHQGKAVITEIPDGGCRGLRLVLHPTGHRLIETIVAPKPNVVPLRG